MPLVVNGTTIPTNVANAFSFNGNNVTSVYFNGTQVWQQSLFSGVWSGSSTGLVTSGNLIRLTNSSQWITASNNPNSIFTNGATSRVTNSGYYSNIVYMSPAPDDFYELRCTGTNTIGTHVQIPSGANAYGSNITYTVGVGFTGTSNSNASGGLNTLYLAYYEGSSYWDSYYSSFSHTFNLITSGGGLKVGTSSFSSNGYYSGSWSVDTSSAPYIFLT